jgi:hypothetical protein
MAEKLPEGHIGNIPAGHKRDEENRQRTDTLAAEIERDAEAGSMNALKIENEIAQHFDEFSGQLVVTKPQAGRHYVWIKAHNITTSSYKAMGFQAVKGDDSECEEYKGQDAAGSSSLRGVGDVLLYWCPIELHERREAHYDQAARTKIGKVEESWAEDANYGPMSPTRRFGPLAHGDQNDPLLRRTVLKGTNGQIERVNDALRTGKPLPAGVQVRDQ